MTGTLDAIPAGLQLLTVEGDIALSTQSFSRTNFEAEDLLQLRG